MTATATAPSRKTAPATAPAVKTGADIDRGEDSGYFTRNQVAWIRDDHRKKIAEKMVRCGWTYSESFKRVREAVSGPGEDYLFTSKDAPTAFEFLNYCAEHLERYDLARSIVSRSEETISVPIWDEDKNRASSFAEDIRIGRMTFDTGRRIIAFSSNPNALRAFGGSVGIDEYAFHKLAEKLWAAAQGRTKWGGNLSVFSSHNGVGTFFNQLVQDAKKGKDDWSYHRIDIHDAIAGGLVERIARKSKRPELTPELFIQECKQDAKFPEIYAQEYELTPAEGSDNLVPLTTILRNSYDYDIERAHFDNDRITDHFGEFDPTRQDSRRKKIANWLTQAYADLFATRKPHRLGFDVAASGTGHLGCIYVDEKTGNGVLVNRAILTTRTEDWDFLQTALYTFLDKLTDVVAAGDETGLGRQICWNAEKRYGDRFHPVNFSTDKSAIGSLLMNQLDANEKRIPTTEPDIGADYFAIKKSFRGSKPIFTETANPENNDSHCDIAWAGGLASWADAKKAGDYHAMNF